MAKYYTQQGLSKSQRRVKRYRFLVLIALLILLAFSGTLALDTYKQWIQSDTETSSTTPVMTTIESTTEIYTTDHFQFQTPTKWRAIPEETKNGRYVYRQFNGSLIEQEIAVDVSNTQPPLALTQITHVLPVTASEEGFLRVEPSGLEHCKKAVKADTNRTIQMVTMNKVSFPCSPTGTNYVVSVGLVGGSHIMPLSRPSGGTANYTITYKNTTALPTARDFLNIIETFETR